MCFKRTVTKEYLRVGFGNYFKCKLFSTSNVSLEQSKKLQNFSEYLQHQNLSFQVFLKYKTPQVDCLAQYYSLERIA